MVAGLEAGGVREQHGAAPLTPAARARTRRAVRETTLPTFQFLQRSLARQSRLFHLRRWILLALRLLFLLLFDFPRKTASAYMCACRS